MGFVSLAEENKKDAMRRKHCPKKVGSDSEPSLRRLQLSR